MVCSAPNALTGERGGAVPRRGNLRGPDKHIVQLPHGRAKAGAFRGDRAKGGARQATISTCPAPPSRRGGGTILPQLAGGGTHWRSKQPGARSGEAQAASCQEREKSRRKEANPTEQGGQQTTRRTQRPHQNIPRPGAACPEGDRNKQQASTGQRGVLVAPAALDGESAKRSNLDPNPP